MAFTQQQQSQTPVQVRVDFPTLPTPPKLALPQDNAAIQAYASGMSAWYESLKTATLDKLNALASEIQALQTQLQTLTKPPKT